MNLNTFTSHGGHFSEGVIAAVTLTTYDTSLTGALPSDGVTGARLRANRETVAGITSILTLWTIVVFLRKEEKIQMTNTISSVLKWCYEKMCVFTLQRHSPVVLLQSL